MKQVFVASFCLFASCSSKPQPAPSPKPTPPKSEPAKPTPQTTPASTMAASAPTPAAPALSLSLVEPNAESCEWSQLDPISSQKKKIAAFPGACKGAQLAFTKDLKRAAVWFTPEFGGVWYEEAGGVPAAFPPVEPTNKEQRLFEVDLDSGKVSPLPLPPEGATDLGYNSKGELLAFQEQQIEPKGGVIEFDGKKLPVPTDLEGVPELVHTLRFSLGKWEIIETKVSATGTDFAPGVRVLENFKDLTLQTAKLLSSHPETKEITDAALKEKLAAYAPAVASRQGQWAKLPSAPVYLWEVNIEFTFSTGKVAFDVGGNLVAPAGLSFTEGDIVAPLVKGDYLLLTRAETGEHPRLYDLKTQKLLYSSDNASAVIFWPTP